jgi:hypothetical protein
MKTPSDQLLYHDAGEDPPGPPTPLDFLASMKLGTP